MNKEVFVRMEYEKQMMKIRSDIRKYKTKKAEK